MSKDSNDIAEALLRITPAPEVDLTPTETSRNKTAQRAVQILEKIGFVNPTPEQKKVLLVAFAQRSMVIYGKAFDIVKVPSDLSLDNPVEVEKRIKEIIIYEIKSTNKITDREFKGYFFALTTAELLVAQSLKDQYRFALVNVKTGHHLELTLKQIFERATGIYPTWSIKF